MKTFILDTTALLYYKRFAGRNVTTESVINEIRKKEEKLLISALVEGRLIDIVDIPKKYISKAIEEAEKTGDISVLSDTDIDILALALYLRDRGEDIIVITDDYAIQNILDTISIKYKEITRKIKYRIKWVYICSKCGEKFKYRREGQNICPICGGEIDRRRERET